MLLIGDYMMMMMMMMMMMTMTMMMMLMMLMAGCTFPPSRGASENASAAKETGGSENKGRNSSASCDAEPFL